MKPWPISCLVSGRKGPNILLGNGFQEDPTPLLLQVGEKDRQRPTVTAHGIGPAIAPLLVMHIVPVLPRPVLGAGSQVA
jgi:hypothetical protein